MEPNEQDNKKNKQNPEETEKKKKTETIQLIKYAVFFVSLYFLIMSAYVYYDKHNYDDGKTFPVNNTLSTELFEGKSYTAKTHIDDSDMWETEAESEPHTTTVPIMENTEITYVTVVFPLDINIASVDELIQIEGIGNVIAEKIVNYRNNYGYFYEYEELMNVDGIGEKKLATLKKYIYIDEQLLGEAESSETTSAENVKASSTTSAELTVTTAQTVVVTPQTTEDLDYIIENFIIDDEDENDYDENEAYESETSAETEYVPNFPLELNSATAEDLMYIDGIGEVIAAKIVEYANRYGFYSVEDLLNVSGIGESKFALIAPYVYVNSYLLPQTTASETETTYWPEWQTEQATALVQTTTINQVSRVNINTCVKADLMQLPGIDSTLADSIISFRNQIGGFQKIEELSLVSGMTNEKLSAIWNYVYI